jgi:hypothetical protein
VNDFDPMKKERFFQNVMDVIEENPEWMGPLILAMQTAVMNRLNRVNDMRTEAEYALAAVIDLVPKKKLEDHPAISVKAKRVLSQCGSFDGTEYAKQLEQEITAGTLRISAEKEQRQEDEAKEEKARRRRLRENRERERYKKHPVCLITGDTFAMAVASGASKLTPYKITGGRDEWNFHAWVLVVDEDNPQKAQENSMLYVGDKPNGRWVYASEEEAYEAIAAISEHGLTLLEKPE